ncbi:MAG TPA: gliding motility lipoprotein GldH [Chitinophagaceae bacterium]
MKRVRNFGLLILVAYCLQLIAVSCTTVDLYEKTVAIPGHKWQSSFKPSFSFTIKDSTSPYQIFLVLRHNDKYNYRNIYINLYTQLEGDSAQKFSVPVELATNEGWKAVGMDDIYEHRALLSEQTLKAGTYTFTLEQIMREDPLENVLDAGIRIEKKQ